MDSVQIRIVVANIQCDARNFATFPIFATSAVLIRLCGSNALTVSMLGECSATFKAFIHTLPL